MNKMNEIAIITLRDTNKYDNNEDIVYYIKKDKDFDNKILKFRDLVKTYTNFQEVEDFIFDNFKQIQLDEYYFNY